MLAPDTFDTNEKQERILRAAVLGASWFIIVLGSVMAVAWLSHSAWPEALLPGFFYMKFNTSLALIGAGVGLIAAFRRSARYATAAGVFVLLIGGVTLLQFLTGANLGVDEILLKDFHYPHNPYPGRMAPAASVAFAFAGIALLLAASERRHHSRLLTLMMMLGFLIFSFGAEGALGHLQGVAYAYSWGSYARMAPQAAVGIMGLGAGLLALTWYRQDICAARVPLWVPGLLSLLVLSFDLSMPRGIATGIAYIPLVFCSLWFSRPHVAFVFAAFATSLWMIASFAKPANNIETWTVLLNRSMQFGALWFVATVLYMRRKTELAFMQSEARLLRHSKALERSNKDLDDFAYIASHDLKEPLRGLFNISTFLQEDYQDKLDAQGMKRLQRLCYLSQRMEKLIDDLLYFSRLGRQDLAVQPTDLNAVIEDIASTMQATLTERQAAISVPLALPIIPCDKLRAREVFYNLIANSIKYNISENKEIEIGCLENLRTKDGIETQVLYVKDNGVGISEEFHEDIFRIFKRINREDDDKKGTGAGLTFVRKIIGRHGGRIWVESQRGCGATFYFTLAPRLSDPAEA